MDVITVIQTLGFPIACVVALGVCFYKVITRDKDEAKEREDKLIDANTKVAGALERVSDTMEKNAEDTKNMVEKSVEANKSMVNIVNSLVDSIKGDLKNVNEKVDKLIEFEESRSRLM